MLLYPTKVPQDLLRCHWADLTSREWLWQIPYAAFSGGIGGLRAADICVGCRLDGYHSKCGPHSISFTWRLLGIQVARSHRSPLKWAMVSLL